MPKSPAAFFRAVAIGVALLGAGPALAQIPLPTPAPQPKSGSAAPDQSGRPVPPAAIGSPSLFNRPPAAMAAKPGETTAFDANQRTLVDRVSAYLSGLRTLVGDFVQVASDGSKTGGQLFMQKPGRVRFEYNDPSPIQLIADGQSLVVRDRKLATQDLYPLGQTPLRFLLADKVGSC